MIKSTIDFLLRPDILFISLFILGLIIILYKLLGFNLMPHIRRKLEDATRERIRRDRIRTRRREQAEDLGTYDHKYFRMYRIVIESIIVSLRWKGVVTVENFTSFFILIYIILVVGLTIFFDNPILGAVVSIPLIFALIATLLIITKARIRAHDNRVMDALDILCPVVGIGVENAIRKNVETLPLKLRPYFRLFLHRIKHEGMYFREAMDELNKNLGPKFTEFAKKAVVFERNQKIGMEELFMDITETSKINRTINARMDVLFQKVNQDMVASIAIILGFLLFVYSNSLTGPFLRTALMGKVVTAVTISCMVMIYTLNQFIQVDLDFTKIKEDEENSK